MKVAIVPSALEMVSVLLTNASRWSETEALRVGLIDPLFVAPSDKVVVLYTTITKSHFTVISTDLAGTA